jgi:hypothetical protein
MAKESDKNEKRSKSQGLVIPLSSIILEEADVEVAGKARNGIDDKAIQNILIERTKLMNDVSGIYELNPDIRLAKEILIAQTLSPKDLSAVKFNLKIDRTVYGGKVDEDLISEIEGHFKSVWNLEALLPKICGEALMDYGAYITLFIPPNFIDKMIAGQTKVSMESFTNYVDNVERKQALSLLESSQKTKLAELGVEDFTLDVNLLKRNYFKEISRGRAIEDISMEAYFGEVQFRTKTWEKEEIYSFKRRRKEQTFSQNPLTINIPVDSAFVIHNPTDPSQHIAYIFPIDEFGRIVSKSKDTDYAGDLEQKLKKAMEDLNSQKKSQAGTGTGAFQIIKGNFNNDLEKTSTNDIVQFYSRKVMEPIIDALKKRDIVDDGIEIGEDQTIYQIMLERALANKKTKLLYVPADYVSYVAFDYSASGQGLGLIEKNRFFASLRAILQIADLMSAVVNSVPRTELAVTLDEADNDPMGTIEALMHELSRLTVMNFPIGSQNPSEIITAIQKAAYSLKIDGGDKFPKTAIERNDVQRSRARTDSDLNDNIKRMLFSGLGVPVEAIDRTLEGETATALILNDLMAAKRAMERQLQFCNCMEDMIRTYIFLSPTLMGKIKDKTSKEYEDFIWALRLSLPSADTSQLEQQLEAYNAANDLYERGVADYMTDDMLRGIVGSNTLSREILNDMRAMFKSEFMRQYMRNNNILPELAQLVSQDKDENITAPLKEHYSAIFKNVGPVIKEILTQAAKIDKIGEDLGGDGQQGGLMGGVATPFGEGGQTAFDNNFDFQGSFSNFADTTPPAQQTGFGEPAANPADDPNQPADTNTAAPAGTPPDTTGGEGGARPL